MTESAHIVITIAAKELRQRVRDRSALFIAFVAPLALAVIISAGLGNAGGNFHATFAVADLDHGPVAATFTNRVLQAPALRRTVTRMIRPDEAGVRAAVRRDDADAGFVVPAGFSAAVQRGEPASIAVITSPNRVIAAQVARSVAGAYATRVNSVALAVRTVLATGGAIPNGSIPALAASIGATPLPIQVEDRARRADTFRPGAYFGPAMAIFFLFFSASAGIRGLISERQTGTLARLLGAPAPRWSILAGKLAAAFVISCLSLGTLVIASQILLGARWGDPWAVAMLCLATVLAVMGIVAVVATLARSEEQAGSYSAILGLVMALLGGNFIPAGSAPALLRRVALATPNGWALRGFSDLGAGQSFSAIAPNLAVLGAIALVAGTVGVRRARHLVAV